MAMEHAGKRLGIYIFDGAEVIEWARPVSVFAVARRLDPQLDAFPVGDSMATVKATASLSVDHKPDKDAFLIPGGIGTRVENAQ
jgi:putative intracellular protease/amidase